MRTIHAFVSHVAANPARLLPPHYKATYRGWAGTGPTIEAAILSLSTRIFTPVDKIKYSVSASCPKS